MSVKLPGDKSLAHRALLLAGLAETASTITNVPDGDDVLRTVAALRALGVDVALDGSKATVTPSTWRSPSSEIDCGNSGTLARLLMGALAGEGIEATLVGDASLSRRPMKRVADPLAELLGVERAVVLHDDTHLPARVLPVRPARKGPIVVDTRAPSAQVKSALLLAARHIEGEVKILEPTATRDHTERMLEALGVELDAREGDIWLYGPMKWKGFGVELAGDPSSAAFLVAHAAMTGRALVVDDVLLNGRRLGFFRVLTLMGVKAGYEAKNKRLGDAVGRIRVRARDGALVGVDVPAAQVPHLIDEVPALVAVALTANGATRIPALAELRHKESDRLARLVDLARAFGGAAHVEGDDLIVDARATATGRVAIRTDGDHRIAMAAHVLGRVLGASVELDQPGCEGTSFPGFLAALDEVARAP